METMDQSPLDFDLHHPKPLLIVISGPSGVGKDAVIKAMKDKGYPFHFVVTMTSRPIRPGEVDGVDYFFVSRERFEELIAADEFIEYANVYGDYKGIPRSQIRAAMASGKDVILRVDVQGAETVRRLCPEAVLIFLIPANKDEWLWRLKNRKTETEEALKLRVETARQELREFSKFDYVVVNAHDRLDEAVRIIAAIIEAEHHRIDHREVCL